jgi:hypothetical protein
MEYEDETWRLLRPHVLLKQVGQNTLANHAMLNIFSVLAEKQVPEKKRRHGSCIGKR